MEVEDCGTSVSRAILNGPRVKIPSMVTTFLSALKIPFPTLLFHYGQPQQMPQAHSNAGNPHLRPGKCRECPPTTCEERTQTRNNQRKRLNARSRRFLIMGLFLVAVLNYCTVGEHTVMLTMIACCSITQTPIVCSTSPMALLIRSVDGLSKCIIKVCDWLT